MKNFFTFAVVLCLTAVTTARAGELSLFEQPGFGGRQVSLRAPASSVSRLGFNDRTSSIVVRSGRWEVCSDDNYSGNCAVFEPGEYGSLDGRFDNRISSAREVSEVTMPAPIIGRVDGNRQDRPASLSPITLFTEENNRGRSLGVATDVIDLSRTKFNDLARSLIIESGTWEFCSDAYFRGQCRLLGPGRYRRLEPPLYRSISSIRVASQGTRPDPRGHVRGDIELFMEENFSGRRIAVDTDTANFAREGYNDQVRSLIINDGQWELCTDANFRGNCTIFGPGRYADLGPLKNRLSSIRRMN